MAKQKLSQFIVIGAGRFGKAVARKLYESGADVLVVDSGIANVNEAVTYATEAMCMDATNHLALEKLGVRNFDACIVAVGDAEASIFITLALKQMGAKRVISKATNEMHRDVLKMIGADAVVFPEEEAGEKLGSALYNPTMLEIVHLTDEYKLIEIRTPPKWVGKSLKELNVRTVFKINIVLAKRGNEIISPDGDFTLSPDDLLVIGGETKDLAKLKTKATKAISDEDLSGIL